jgi:hypothetical protein
MGQPAGITGMPQVWTDWFDTQPSFVQLTTRWPACALPTGRLPATHHSATSRAHLRG